MITYSINLNDAGKNIRTIRNSKNIKQYQLADLCSISGNHMLNIEHARKNASLEIMIRICNELHCTFSHIYKPDTVPVLNMEQEQILSGLEYEEIPTFLSLLNTYKISNYTLNEMLLSGFNIPYGNMIGIIRRHKKVSCKKLAAQCYLKEASLRNIESGNAVLTLENLLIIASSLNILADCLIAKELTNKSSIYSYILSNIFLTDNKEEYKFLIDTGIEIKERLIKRRLLKTTGYYKN